MSLFKSDIVNYLKENKIDGQIFLTIQCKQQEKGGAGNKTWDKIINHQFQVLLCVVSTNIFKA